MEAAKDSDLMPFGAHKDEKLGDVPASYLLWFGSQTWAKKFPRILKYVEDNKKWLTEEAKNNYSE